MASTDRQRWARVPPHPRLETAGPADRLGAGLGAPPGVEALPSYVWLDTPGKVLHVEAARLELRDHPPA
jgi:hypothetical protein